MPFASDFGDSFYILGFSFCASLFVIPVGAFIGARRAASGRNALLSVIAGIVAASVLFIAVNYVVSGMLRGQRGDHPADQFLLTVMIAAATFATAWLVARLVGKSFETRESNE
jgi:zinc transporter ZupT